LRFGRRSSANSISEGKVESTLNFLLRRESCRRTFQIALAKLRRIDHIAAHGSGSRTVSRQIAAQGQFVSSLHDDDISVNGRPIWKLPIDVNLLFAAAGKYAEEHRAIGCMEFREATQPDGVLPGHPDKVTLELVLPMELAARFTTVDRAPLITVGASGFSAAKLGAPPGMGTYAWDTSATASLPIDECVVSDPEHAAAEDALSVHAQARAVTAILERIETRLSDMVRTLKRPMLPYVWCALGLLGAILLFVIVRHWLGPR
jgi:hypothetical protein